MIDTYFVQEANSWSITNLSGNTSETLTMFGSDVFTRLAALYGNTESTKLSRAKWMIKGNIYSSIPFSVVWTMITVPDGASITSAYENSSACLSTIIGGASDHEFSYRILKWIVPSYRISQYEAPFSLEVPLSSKLLEAMQTDVPIDLYLLGTCFTADSATAVTLKTVHRFDMEATRPKPLKV